MKANAAVAIRPGVVEYQPVDVPEPAPGEVVVRVTHSWISNGTEGSFVRGERIGGDTPRREGDPLPFPHVPGYQKVGIVEWVGEEVDGLRKGDRVFATMSRVLYMFYPSGGHVSPAVTDASQIWKLPEGVSIVDYSGLVLTQVGYNVGMRPELLRGDSVVVIGDGMVGHWAAQTYQHRGARVLMLGRHDYRLGLLQLGESDAAVNVQAQEAASAVRGWAPEGVQVVADTVGSVPALEALIPSMRRDSHIVSAGFYGPDGRLDIQKLRDREITLHAPSGWTTPRMDATLDLVARGVLKTEHLITHGFHARQAGAAFDLILSRREAVLGVVLDWH